MQAADPVNMYAKIEGNGIKQFIKHSTHYRLLLGTRTLVHYNNGPSIEMVTKPQAVFYGYNHEEYKKKFLGVIEVDDLEKSTIECLDQLIDPHVSLPTIKKAAIFHCPHRGRMLYFYDQQGNQIDYTILHYHGSINIKSEENNIRLIKPHALLRQLEEVREYVPECSYLRSGYTEYWLEYDN